MGNGIEYIVYLAQSSKNQVQSTLILETTDVGALIKALAPLDRLLSNRGFKDRLKTRFSGRSTYVVRWFHHGDRNVTLLKMFVFNNFRKFVKTLQDIDAVARQTNLKNGSVWITVWMP